MTITHPIPLGTPVRVPGRGIVGRLTGHLKLDGVLARYAVEHQGIKYGHRTACVAMVGLEEVEVVTNRA
jgi:hypothetical protein